MLWLWMVTCACLNIGKFKYTYQMYQSIRYNGVICVTIRVKYEM